MRASCEHVMTTDQICTWVCKKIANAGLRLIVSMEHNPDGHLRLVFHKENSRCPGMLDLVCEGREQLELHEALRQIVDSSRIIANR